MNATAGPHPSRRRRWKRRALLPPLLLLLIGFSVIGYRVTRPDWRGLEIAPSRPRPAVALQTPKAPEPVPTPTLERKGKDEEQGPSASDENAEAEAEVEVESEPADVEPTEPIDVEPTSPTGLATDRILALASEMNHPPEVEPASVPPELTERPALREPEEPQEPVDPAQVWNDIRREAVAQKQERIALAALKDQLLAEDIEHTRQRQAEQAQRRREQLSEQNQTFREELTALVSADKAGAVAEIRKLASLPPPRPRPRTVDASEGPSRAQTLSRSAGLRRAWVAKLRHDGQQDSVILADLLEAHRLNRLSRNGPRSDDDAVLRAVRDLLSVPADAQPDQLQQILLSAKQSASPYPTDPRPQSPPPRRPPPRQRAHCTPSVREILAAHPYAHPDQPQRDELRSMPSAYSYPASSRSGRFGQSRRR